MKNLGKLGFPVLYTSKIDNGPGNDVMSPGIIIRTKRSNVAQVVERWGPEPQVVHSASDPTVTHTTAARPESFVAELESYEHVDLVIFGLGKTYREYNVLHGFGRGEWHFAWERESGVLERDPADG